MRNKLLTLITPTLLAFSASVKAELIDNGSYNSDTTVSRPTTRARAYNLPLP